MSLLCGCPSYPLTEQIADTIAAHGKAWAYNYYVRDHGIPDWQWTILTDAYAKRLFDRPEDHTQPVYVHRDEEELQPA